MRLVATRPKTVDMVAGSPRWKLNQDFAVGKGATVQRYAAIVGKDRFEIDVAPWGEGYLRVNGYQAACVDDAADSRQAFRRLNHVAHSLLEGQSMLDI